VYESQVLQPINFKTLISGRFQLGKQERKKPSTIPEWNLLVADSVAAIPYNSIARAGDKPFMKSTSGFSI